MPQVNASGGFWQRSLHVYARDGVKDALLMLQEQCALDVNVLLFCCYAAERGAPCLEDELLAQVLEIQQQWQRRFIEPLRQLRRQLTPSSEATAPLREQFLALELSLERVEQEALERLLPAPARMTPEQARSRAAQNIRAYAASQALDDFWEHYGDAVVKVITGFFTEDVVGLPRTNNA